MRVVSDTSTLCYLILIEEAQLLPELFTEIAIPPAVRLLAEQMGADLLLLDDWKARELARDRGLAITGLIGVLDMAIKKSLVDPATTVERLRATTFRVSDRLLATLLR